MLVKLVFKLGGENPRPAAGPPFIADCHCHLILIIAILIIVILIIVILKIVIPIISIIVISLVPTLIIITT